MPLVDIYFKHTQATMEIDQECLDSMINNPNAEQYVIEGRFVRFDGKSFIGEDMKTKYYAFERVRALAVHDPKTEIEYTKQPLKGGVGF